jgi:hypothetical protein
MSVELVIREAAAGRTAVSSARYHEAAISKRAG